MVVQGITGRMGMQFAARLAASGTKIVAGVTPGKGGTDVGGVPVFNTMRDAIAAEGADVSLIVVPPFHVLGAALEAIDEGIRMMVIYTDDVPVHDTLQVLTHAAKHSAIVVGPGAAGIAVPGKCNVSEIPDWLLTPGRIGVAAKSGSLSNETLAFLLARGIGLSAVCCVGGGMITGLRLPEVVARLAEDEDTSAIVLLGEVGGSDEVDAVAAVRSCNKPVLAYVAGHFAPPNVRMGHAGAILGEASEGAPLKSQRLREVGAMVANSISELFDLIEETNLSLVRPGGST